MRPKMAQPRPAVPAASPELVDQALGALVRERLVWPREPWGLLSSIELRDRGDDR